MKLVLDGTVLKIFVIQSAETDLLLEAKIAILGLTVLGFVLMIALMLTITTIVMEGT